ARAPDRKEFPRAREDGGPGRGGPAVALPEHRQPDRARRAVGGPRPALGRRPGPPRVPAPVRPRRTGPAVLLRPRTAPLPTPPRDRRRLPRRHPRRVARAGLPRRPEGE